MKLKFVETSGRGVDIRYYLQLRSRHNIPNYSMSTDNDVVVKLDGGHADLNFYFLVLNLKSVFILELVILKALFHKKQIPLPEISNLIQYSQ